MRTTGLATPVLLALTLLLTACGSLELGTSPTPTLASSGVIVTVTRSSGFEGRIERRVVHADGKVEIFALVPDFLADPPQVKPVLTYRGRIPRERADRLQTLLNSRDWQRLDAEYGERQPDAGGTFIEGGGRSVAYGIGKVPDVIREVLQLSTLGENTSPKYWMIREREGQALAVYADGFAKITEGSDPLDSPILHSTRIPKEQIEELEKIVSSPEWRHFERGYERKEPGADDLLISFTVGGGQIEVYEGEPVPAVLGKVLEEFDEMWAAAEKGG